jgi:hypothetical protein
MAQSNLSHFPCAGSRLPKKLLAATLPEFSGLIRIYRAQAFEQTVGIGF